MENLARIDPEVAEAILNETRREGSQLEMIASENFVSEAVLEAMGTVLTNKYAEGYPGRRYYGGCEFVDVVGDARHRPGEAALRRPTTPTSSRTPGLQREYLAAYLGTLRARETRFSVWS